MLPRAMTGTQRMGTTTAAPETQPVDAPVAFGKYRVVARLGAGGFVVVCGGDIPVWVRFGLVLGAG